MRRESIAVVETLDRAVVLELAVPASRPVVLEGTAHAIWSEVDGVSDTVMIVERLAAAMGLEPEQIHDDVDAFLVRLQTAHIVTVLDIAAPPLERPTE